MYDLRMSRGASTVVNTCAGVQPGEQVLIITEHSKMSIAESLAAAAYAAGAEATLVVMTPRDLDGQEPPAAIAAAMRASDVFLCAVSRSITHTHAVREATAAGARGRIFGPLPRAAAPWPLRSQEATACGWRRRRAPPSPSAQRAAGAMRSTAS